MRSNLSIMNANRQQHLAYILPRYQLNFRLNNTISFVYNYNHTIHQHHQHVWKQQHLRPQHRHP